MITRLYYPSHLDHLALEVESSGNLDQLPTDLKRLISSYHQGFLPHINQETTKSRELGEGSIGKVRLFQPREGEPFVQKVFHGGNPELSFQGLSPAQMNFFIDLAVARALKNIKIASQIEACSPGNTALIMSFRKGWLITSENAVSDISESHLKSFVLGAMEAHSRGVTLDSNPTNILFDPNEGFSLVDALPTSKVIRADDHTDLAKLKSKCRQASEAALEAMFDPERMDDIDELLNLGTDVEVRRNTYEISMAEQIFQAAKLAAYALRVDLPIRALTNTADHFLHELPFQRGFLSLLERVLGLLKQQAPAHFEETMNRTLEHIALLGHKCHIGTGWNLGVVSYTKAAPGEGMADNPSISRQIEAIKVILRD